MNKKYFFIIPELSVFLGTKKLAKYLMYLCLGVAKLLKLLLNSIYRSNFHKKPVDKVLYLEFPHNLLLLMHTLIRAKYDTT